MSEFIQALARMAGGILFRHFREDWSLLSLRTSAKEAVTRYDNQIDRQVVKEISRRYPDHSLLTEESGAMPGDPDWVWILDSLDGTGNFANFNPLFSICIALMHRGELLLGAVYAPAIDEFFFARKGKGAYLNGHRLRVTGVSELHQSYLLYCEGGEKDRERTGKLAGLVYPHAIDLRKLGSAGLETAWVAAGKAEAYFTTAIEPWDVAAGVLLVQEAGGQVTDFQGKPWQPKRTDLLCSNGPTHAELLKLLGQP